MIVNKALKLLAFFSVILIFEVLSNKSVIAQDNWWKDKKYKTEAKRQKFANCKKVFDDIADGINYSNIYMIITYFGSEVYLNFLDKEKGYYSQDQAQFILDNFLINNPVFSFKWKLSNRSGNYAFAFGKYKYKKNGYVNNYDVSVSLKYNSTYWVIEQIIVN